jgi:hypothetical protein
MIEDPASSSIRHLAQEAYAKLACGEATFGKGNTMEVEGFRWISPTPFSVKLRLFCLPYAGGVSENVFARCEKQL